MRLFQRTEMTIEAAVLAAFTELQIRRRPLREMLLNNERRATTRVMSLPESSLVFARAAEAVRRVYRGLRIRNACLRESLVLHRMLRTRGIDADFRIGVNKAGHTLLGHAWVEHQGHPVLDEHVAARYVPLPPIIRERTKAR